MRKFVCNCGNEIETDFPEVFDARNNPDIFDRILEGTFLSVTCPVCETLVKPELPVRIRDDSQNIDIYFYPDGEREKYLGGKLTTAEADRIVFGYPELVEKVTICLNRLNDMVIETIKYFYLQKGGSKSDISIRLDSVDEANLQFHIHGLKKNEIGVTKIPLDFYKKIENDLASIKKKENLQEIINPPYVSIKKIYIEADG